MAYNNGFPMSYQQAYQPQQYQPQMPQANTGIIWVSGLAGAKAYLVAPNSTVQLWDSEAQVVYLKSADASGMPSIKILDYTIRDAQAAQTPFSQSTADYATRKEMDALRAEMNALKAMISKKENDNESTVQRNAKRTDGR